MADTSSFDDFESIFKKTKDNEESTVSSKSFSSDVTQPFPVDPIIIKEETKTEEPVDMVNHPPHYDTGKFECIDVMLETQGVKAVMDFCICNAFKYLYRHNNKNGVEDVKKAKWYVDKYIELADSIGG